MRVFVWSILSISLLEVVISLSPSVLVLSWNLCVFDWFACWFWAFFGSYQVSIFDLLGLSSKVVPGYELFHSLSIPLEIRSRSYLLSSFFGLSIQLIHPVTSGWRLWTWRVLSPGAWSFVLSSACAIHHRRIRRPEVVAMEGFLALPCSKKLCSNHHVLLISFWWRCILCCYPLLLA